MLYNALVRPHLEYCQQAWVHANKGDLDMLEGVQCRVTKMIASIKHLDYQQRLKELRMYTVERRFVRGDLIELFKIIKGLDKLSFDDFFILNNTCTRGHTHELKKQTFRVNKIRQNAFSIRVENKWIALPQHVVDSQTLETFKKRLYIYMDSRVF